MRASAVHCLLLLSTGCYSFIIGQTRGRKQVAFAAARHQNSRRVFPVSSGGVLTSAATVNLLGGMLGGAVGVGVAYPLDTLKTKQQARNGDENNGPANVFELVMQVITDEGIGGFYSGVSSTMIGQAIIKGVVFLCYETAKGVLVQSWMGDNTITLILAACFSGSVGSLAVTPVERVKCVMQASGVSAYKSPIQCMSAIVRADGLRGLLFRGLGATLLREVPAYGFYFVSYDLVKSWLLGTGGLPVALIPLVGGAAAGAMSWIPVYPVDVVKTNIQVQDGSEGDQGFLATAHELWKTGGMSAFWDGLTPKLARAVVNHAVTFYVFDAFCSALTK